MTGFIGATLFFYGDAKGNLTGASMADAKRLGDDSDFVGVGNPIFHDLLECLRGGEIEGGIGPMIGLLFIDNEIHPFHMMKEAVGAVGDGQADLDFFPRDDLFRKDLDRYYRFIGKNIRGRDKGKHKEKKTNKPW